MNSKNSTLIIVEGKFFISNNCKFLERQQTKFYFSGKLIIRFNWLYITST
jgi:hypothetical protein